MKYEGQGLPQLPFKVIFLTLLTFVEIESSMGKKGVEPQRALKIQNFKIHKQGRLVALGSKRKLETQKGGFVEVIFELQ